jgi:serine/threonine-protein kinase
VDEAVRIATAVAGALQAAHDRGVIHRDIKPANILLSGGQPLVADFGIALAAGAGGARLTETGLSVGTPYYMSPEQATGDQRIGPTADTYALGCVLYEMLVGEPPYLGNTAQAVLGKIIQGLPVSATAARKTVPAHVDAAIRKALEKLPADRFTRAADFGAALSDPSFRHGAGADGAGVVVGVGPWKRLTITFGSLAAVLTVALASAFLRPGAPGPVIRYQLETTDLVTSISIQFAFAPDGSWMVYTGSGGTPGTTQLWVKARDRLEATPLDATMEATNPSVSPDGHWIAFIVGGQVRKVPVAGGVATTIADSARASSPVWLDDGTVAYADLAWRVRSVPADGGVSEVVYAPADGWYTAPLAALPNGRGLLFLRCMISCMPTGELWVKDGRSGEAKRLLPDGRWGAYAEGRLLFVRQDGSVFGAPFDLDALALQGAPVPLFDGVTVTNQAQIGLGASGRLGYLSGALSSDRWQAVWVSREGQATPVDTAWSFQTTLDYPGWSLSPDGTRLAMIVRNEPTLEDIWIKELDPGSLSRLTFSEFQDINPRWTPDGRAVTFVSNRGGDYDLYQRKVDGTGADSLLLALEAVGRVRTGSFESGISEALWSRDGQWLVMRVGGVPGQSDQRDIVALRLGRDTVARPLLTAPYDEAVPALSPDDRWLAYESGETGRREIFVRPFPDVESGKWQVSTAGGTSPVWAHSGRELFFINGSRELVSQAVRPGPAFQLGEQRVLFSIDASYELAADYTSFDVGPDDRRFLMVRQTAEAAAEAPQLVVVENWLEEVDRIMRSGIR